MPPVNGRTFSAEDVKYCVEAYQKAPVQSAIYRDVERVETPDANTVVFKMKQPAAYFLRVLMQPMNLVFSREQHQSSEGLKSGPIGTGAFIYESGQDRVGWKARKNPDYFKKDPFTGKQLPYVDRIETVFYPDTNAAVAAFRAKQFDVYYAGNRSAWMDVLKTNPELITQITTPPPSAAVPSAHSRVTAHPPLRRQYELFMIAPPPHAGNPIAPSAYRGRRCGLLVGPA